MTTNEPSVSLSLDMDAPAHEVFTHLAQPSDHATIDGTGMLRGTEHRRALSRVIFDMKMFNDEMGDYVMENHVVEFEPDRRIVWEPVLKSIDNPEFQSNVRERAHHRWGWELTPLPGDRTRVTEFFDCSAAPEWLRKATKEGEQWRMGIEATLSNLAKLIERGS